MKFTVADPVRAQAELANNPDTSTMDNLIKGLIALGEPISKIAACLLLCTNSN